MFIFSVKGAPSRSRQPAGCPDKSYANGCPHDFPSRALAISARATARKALRTASVQHSHRHGGSQLAAIAIALASGSAADAVEEADIEHGGRRARILSTLSESVASLAPTASTYCFVANCGGASTPIFSPLIGDGISACAGCARRWTYSAI